ncbi:MAG: SDR family oxidoreductase [Acidimicrobiales bacterium]|jgi:meso-butanediol dehydrogenase/(S,S)-butanediol dehydrogenase/diacetyl reductase
MTTARLDPSLLARPIAVVTGAEGGIGTAIVERLVADGMTVAAVDVRAMKPARDNVYTFSCDVADPVQVDALVRRVEAEVGKAAAVVNCAGIGVWFKRVGEISAEEWNRVIGVNLSGAFYMTRGFLPALVEQRGSVVNVASVHGVATAPGYAAYAASKAGLFGLTKGTAVDYGKDGVRANCIVLGSVDTNMTRDYEAEAMQRGLVIHSIRPWERTGPGPVADVVSFLLSSGAAFLNGALVPVDGGLLSWL